MELCIKAICEENLLEKQLFKLGMYHVETTYFPVYCGEQVISLTA